MVQHMGQHPTHEAPGHPKPLLLPSKSLSSPTSYLSQSWLKLFSPYTTNKMCQDQWCISLGISKAVFCWTWQKTSSKLLGNSLPWPFAFEKPQSFQSSFTFLHPIKSILDFPNEKAIPSLQRIYESMTNEKKGHLKHPQTSWNFILLQYNSSWCIFSYSVKRPRI